ncbi:hypothetical protein CVS47_00497 [Microbacterium lemovicicum]|uniref:Nucleotide-diphospho-sugar transferase domain-containing protein n=1 Tax=Microbacterium lemovicicum TaxID=1072463 RepID=A0A3Q9IYF8_9MICO|nr:hypothetical protein [Microbacterium lemovicicum]AZS35899.1 hypothetical protein CVS47_00497 [Microbacterium lemovicicum]
MSGLIFTIAQNGYDTAFLQCIASQRAYARRIGVEYVAVTRPSRVEDTALSAWLKLPLAQAGLESGYDWVMYIDADCEVSGLAPDFREGRDPNGSVFMADGRSGRVNSGVIMCRNTEAARTFLNLVIDSATSVVPPEDRLHLKYENGNVIFVDRVHGGVSPLSQEWNNASDPDLADFVRHYTGDMRPMLKRTPWRELQYRVLKRFRSRQLSKFQSQPESRGEGFVTALMRLRDEVLEAHPEITLAVTHRR